MNDITIQNSTLSTSTQGPLPTTEQTPLSGSTSFGQMLKGSLERVNQLQTEADANVTNLANGKQTDIHQTMIAVEKADVSFELLMQIRNKLIAAYDKVMRMPV
jgi:flagellar hook-basal body complex protein FliE